MKLKLLALGILLTFAFASQAQKYRICMKTTMGNVLMELYDGTPKHRDNFVKLAHDHFYDSILFHRVIPQFMDQAGDPDSKQAKKGVGLGDGDVKYKIPAEIQPEKYFHKRGALGAAREDNPAKASSGAQFYIVTGKIFTDSTLEKTEKRTHYKISAANRKVYKTIGGAPHLDNNYTVFGEVLKGMDVVQKIGEVKRDSSDRPIVDVRIIKLRTKRKFLFWWW
ncbi:peptidylprolyl isomerase [Rhizosphaericola mali]|uniref:peptidylprolyl isomerase n=1 Tax=Rhizosphaericola mali TaxID=2545455 RepID=A0A5P2G917_9BACT|nr:peptidylprolyl isomerase [Rhizosphaericola mali]QES90210.1 peptidylprolyl isomerase [Rhizosphaericola mali]